MGKENKNTLVIFEGREIRKIWHKEEWWFVIVDIIEVLTDSVQPEGYLKDMRRRDEELSKGWGQIATLLAIETPGGSQKINCSNIEGIFRIIQSISSPKVEPLKLWLAKVGYERIQEISDPEKSINRGRENWKRLGRSQKWIQQRMMGQETRNKLTDYWKEHEIKGPDEYAILTNIIHQEWSDLTIGQHKNLKGLQNQNLRDHMDEAELIFTALAELSTRNVAEKDLAVGFQKNAVAAKKGGGVSKRARKDFEKLTGKKVVTRGNFLKIKSNKRIKGN